MQLEEQVGAAASLISGRNTSESSSAAPLLNNQAEANCLQTLLSSISSKLDDMLQRTSSPPATTVNITNHNTCQKSST